MMALCVNDRKLPGFNIREFSYFPYIYKITAVLVSLQIQVLRETSYSDVENVYFYRVWLLLAQEILIMETSIIHLALPKSFRCNGFCISHRYILIVVFPGVKLPERGADYHLVPVLGMHGGFTSTP
jgi:hypothetical protein